ncbi:CARDB domain-containing protein [Salinirubrum litoreum]|uniref:CARDB domain-containing protein n=1 Tax=Salinirubrum litoreum TaxID=1126234 RepID=A0ABD5RDT4_9EURY|nr:CARDB domain-containing protein [Salinirubrum litoreum]
MNRVLAVVFTLLLCVPTGAVAVPDARLTVSDVTVSPDSPVVGETITVSATVQNSAGSDSPAQIKRVELRDANGDRLTRANNLGSLSGGDSLTVPLTVSFDDPGTRDLQLRVVAEDADGDEVTLTRPVPVAVETASPQAEITVADPAVDSPTRVAVELSNPAATAVRNLEVTFADSLGAPTVDRRVVPQLDAGETTVVNLTTVPADSGTQRLEVNVSFTGASGTEQVRTVGRTVDVEPYRDDLGLSVSRVQPEEQDAGVAGGAGGLAGLLGGAAGGAGGGQLTQGGSEEADPTGRVAVEVTNFGSVVADDVVVTPVAGNRTLPRVVLGDRLAPGESGTVEVDLSEVRDRTAVEFRVDYRAGVRDSRTTATYDWRPAVAELTVTDLDVTVGEDGEVRITGNAANVGDGEATGVVVSVVPSEGVSPAYPQRDYFAGTIAGSDFAPFDLTAEVTDGVESVTVRITYRTDGVPVTREIAVPVPSDDGGGGALASLGGATTAGVPAGVVLVGLLAVGLVGAGTLVRGRRGDDHDTERPGRPGDGDSRRR